MTSDLILEVLKSGIGLFFALLQFLLIGAIAAVFKMYMDQRDMKKDLNACFSKLRCMESRVPKHKEED